MHDAKNKRGLKNAKKYECPAIAGRFTRRHFGKKEEMAEEFLNKIQAECKNNVVRIGAFSAK